MQRLPLVGARLVPWFVGMMGASLILRAVSWPALSMSPRVLWRILLVSSGILELGAPGMVLVAGISSPGVPLWSFRFLRLGPGPLPGGESLADAGSPQRKNRT